MACCPHQERLRLRGWGGAPPGGGAHGPCPVVIVPGMGLATAAAGSCTGWHAAPTTGWTFCALGLASSSVSSQPLPRPSSSSRMSDDREGNCVAAVVFSLVQRRGGHPSTRPPPPTPLAPTKDDELHMVSLSGMGSLAASACFERQRGSKGPRCVQEQSGPRCTRANPGAQPPPTLAPGAGAGALATPRSGPAALSPRPRPRCRPPPSPGGDWVQQVGGKEVSATAQQAFSENI